MRRIVFTSLLLVTSACGADEYCETVDCEKTAGSTSLAASSGASDATTATTTSGGPGGSGGSGDGGSTSQGGSGGAGGTGTGGNVAFDVTPGDTKVGILRALEFDATVDVEWSVTEAEGGTIDDDGLYLSPEEPGVFHVVATAESGEEVEVEVTVAPLGLEVAGGIPGGAGNLDGIPERARFHAPRGFAVLDGPGDDYLIADTANHTIRLYREDDGEVTTLAGASGATGSTNGIGTAARFDHPTDIVVDGEMAFVADADGTCIRAVQISDGQVSTFAGACGASQDVNGATGAQTRFTRIESMVLAPDGSGLYVCQATGSRIRRIDGSTGETVSVFAEGFQSGDCDLAANTQSDVIYAYSSGDGTVREITMAVSGAAPVVATIPGTDQQLLELAYLSGHETLYAFDSERASAGAPYETFLYGGDSSFIEVAGGVIDYVDGPLDSARFLTPAFLVSNDNQLYFGDQEGHTVRRIDFDGVDSVETIFGKRANVYAVDGSSTTGRLLAPFSLALGENDADVFVAGAFFDRVIRRIDGATGAIDTFSGVRESYMIGSEPSFDTPVDGPSDEAVFGIIIDLVRVGATLYVADTSSTIRAVSLDDGAVEVVAGALNQTGADDGFGAAARFDFVDIEHFGGGLATDGVDLFISDPGNHAIRKLDLATNEVTTIAGGTEGNADGEGLSAQFVTPAGLAYDRGMLYIADAEDHTIRAMDLASGEVTTLTGNHGLPGVVDGGITQARFSGPFRVAADGIGNLYVTSLGEGTTLPHSIRRIRLEDVQTSIFSGSASLYGFGDGPLPATVGCPVGVVVDAAGDLLFADACDGAIGAIRSL